MSEHSIEELERQLQQADDRAKEANRLASEARRRLMVAKFEATGFKGCLAEYTERGKTIQFLPCRVARWGTYIEGPKLKKDGTPSSFDGYCDPKRATNLGPYKAPGAAE